MSDGDSHAFFDLSRELRSEVRRKFEQSFRNGTPLAIVGAPTSSSHCFLTLYAEKLSDCAALEFVPALPVFISILPRKLSGQG
jgi:hypothetical protein